MAMNTSKLLSGRVLVTSYDDLTPDRYQFLGLSQAEPNLGAPANSGSLLTSTSTGTRSWSNVINVNSNIVTFYANYSFPPTDGTQFQVLFTDGNGAVNWGTITTGRQLINGNSNVVVTFDGNVTISSAGNANILVVTGTGANVSGTFNVTGNTIVGNLDTANANVTTLNVSGISNLGPVGNVKITGGSLNYVLQTDGTGNLSWVSIGTGNGISNGTSNITAGIVNGNITVGINGVANTVVFTDTGINVANSVTAENLIGPLSNGNSNVYIPTANGNVNITANGNTTLTVTSTGANLVGNLVVGNIANANVISANYLVSTQGCITLSQGVIAVSGNNAGIFASLVDDVNIGLEANVVMGSPTGNVTSRGTFNAPNIETTGTLSAQKITVGDLYSDRTAITVTTNTIVDSFDISEYRSAKYTINASTVAGYQALEVLLIHDGINSLTTVYGNLTTTGSDIITIDSSVSLGIVELLATATGGTTTVNLLGTYVP